MCVRVCGLVTGHCNDDMGKRRKCLQGEKTKRWSEKQGAVGCGNLRHCHPQVIILLLNQSALSDPECSQSIRQLKCPPQWGVSVLRFLFVGIVCGLCRLQWLFCRKRRGSREASAAEQLLKTERNGGPALIYFVNMLSENKLRWKRGKIDP